MPRVAKGVENRLVALVARILEQVIVGIAFQWKGRLPRSRQHDWILDADFVLDRVLADARETLDDAQRLACGNATTARTDDQHRRAAVEVRGLDDQRAPLPTTARFAKPRANRRTGTRPPVERDDARFVNQFEPDDNVARRLEDLDAAVVHEREH